MGASSWAPFRVPPDGRQCRNRSGDVPDPQAVQRGPLAQLRRVAHHRIDDHRRWRHQPPVDPHSARGPRRIHRWGRGVVEIAGQSLVAIHDWTFLLGPGFCVGVNGILLGWLMYRTGLMPPRLALLGVVGGPLIFLSAIAVLFGAYEQDGAHALFSIPEFLFEASFAIYLIVKGFRPSPVLSGEPATQSAYSEAKPAPPSRLGPSRRRSAACLGGAPRAARPPRPRRPPARCRRSRGPC